MNLPPTTSVPVQGSMCCLQSGLLAQKDSLTPLIWVVVQTILNIIGDILLIKVWKGGLPGAAWATLLSQLAGTAGLVWMMGSKGKVSRVPASTPPLSHLILVKEVLSAN